MLKLDLEKAEGKKKKKRKAEETKIKLPTSIGSLKQQENPRKIIYFCFIDYAKACVWITIKCGKF